MNNLDFYRTRNPSQAVVVDEKRMQFVLVYTRSSGILYKNALELIGYLVNDVAKIDEEAQRINYEYGSKHFIKLRSVMIDDKTGNFVLNVSYIHDREEKPKYTGEDLKRILGDGEVRYGGQGQSVEVEISTALCSSESFSPISDADYK